MINKKYNIDLSGLEARIDRIQDIHTIMRAIEYRAPSTSRLNLSLASVGGKFDALLTIVSPSYSFESRTHGSSIDNVMDLIKTDIFKQLKSWLSYRAK